MSRDVFICYTPRDGLVANAVRAVLEAENVSCWIASRDLPADASAAETIIGALDDARAVVFVFSSNTNNEHAQVRREIEYAANRRIPMFPFRIENVKPTRVLEVFLPASQWLDAFPPPLESHLDKLSKSVKAALRQPRIEQPKTDQPPQQPIAEQLRPMPEPLPPQPISEQPASTPSVVQPQGPPRIRPPVFRETGAPLKQSHMLLIAAVVVAAMLVAGAGIWWTFLRDNPADRQAWDVAAKQDSIPAYHHYLQAQPHGYYQSQATDRIASLTSETDAAFARAKAANTASAFQDFLDHYARQEHDADAARAAYANLSLEERKVRDAFTQASTARTRDAYRSFIAAYGTSAFAADARKRLAACHSETKKSTERETTELDHRATGSGSDSNQACRSARSEAVDRATESCRQQQGQPGTTRVLDQDIQNGSTVGGRIIGSLLGGVFGNRNSARIGSDYRCTVEIAFNCDKPVSRVRQVDICP